mgnify:CR=1 FL=1
MGNMYSDNMYTKSLENGYADDHLRMSFALLNIDGDAVRTGDMDFIKRWLTPGITTDTFRRHVCEVMTQSWVGRDDVVALAMLHNDNELCVLEPEMTRLFLLQLLFSGS